MGQSKDLQKQLQSSCKKPGVTLEKLERKQEPMDANQNYNDNLTPVRMATIRKARNNKCGGECGEGNPCTLFVGM